MMVGLEREELRDRRMNARKTYSSIAVCMFISCCDAIASFSKVKWEIV